MEPIVIHHKRSRLFLLLLGTAALVAAAVWMLTLPREAIGIKGVIAAWFGLPLFTLIGAAILLKLISTRPAVTIDRHGITDHASGLAVGFIPWSDFAGAYIAQTQNQKYLAIALVNPQQYVAKAFVVRRLIMRLNSSWSGSIVNIPQIALPLTVEELLVHINRYAQAFGEGCSA